MKTTAPTMRDVAGRAKVSTSTVALALRNSPLVAVEAGERIRAVAEALSYKTHPWVAAPVRSRRNPAAGASAPVLAMVDTRRRRHGWRDNRP